MDLSRIDQCNLAKAFFGELVLHDLAYVPASVLMKQLHASQAEISTNGTPLERVRVAPRRYEVADVIAEELFPRLRIFACYCGTSATP